MSDNPQPPELLAPAGNLDCVRAAIENGADAVYFGLDGGFNARARATNFGIEQLPRVMELLHSRGVCGYVTLNTLVFTEELEAIQQYVLEISQAGVDAVLVQDLGLVRLVREAAPDLPVHASTQMTMTSAETIQQIAALGIERVVVGRELSVKEIRKITEASDMAIEVFVHGALCVAYSGQCLTSESLGGRSANRGQCAQACRLPYELVVDGKDRDLSDRKYLLSPQDLAAYALVPDLVDAGVCSLKIEGRLKTPEYVANITRHYREAIDAATDPSSPPFQMSPQSVQEMELSFSRGFSHGWLEGCDHKELVPATSSAKRGIRIGSVQRVTRNGLVVSLADHCDVKSGDGIVLEGDRASGEEQGGSVYQVTPIPDRSTRSVELQFRHGQIDFEQCDAGQAIFKTSDPQLQQRLRKTFTSADPVRKRDVMIVAHGKVDAPLVVDAQVIGTSHRVRVQSDVDLMRAKKHPLSTETLSQQFGRLGATAFGLQQARCEVQGEVMLPLSVLGRMRKQLVEALQQSLVQRPQRGHDSSALDRLRNEARKNVGPDSDQGREAELIALCRTTAQLEAVIGEGVETVYADFHDIREYRDAVQIAHRGGGTIYLATPRIQKPGEYGLFRSMLRHEPDGFLVRNLSGLAYFCEQKQSVVADFSLNITNELSADFIIDRGAAVWTPSYDLNRQQLLGLIGAIDPAQVEVVVHQHMPMFHMEHCVFCSVLSPGTNKTNCGRPCDHHVVHLRDRVGMEHALQADVGCRNTLYNAAAQSAAEAVPMLIDQRIRRFRIEFLEQSAKEIRRTLELYRRLIRKEVSGKSVWSQLKASNRVGVTRGTLEEQRNPLKII